jgi:hypothetical protein
MCKDHSVIIYLSSWGVHPKQILVKIYITNPNIPQQNDPAPGSA